MATPKANGKRETVHATEVSSVRSLMLETECAFGIGGSTHTRIVDGATGKTFSRATFKVETLTDGSEVFEVVLK